MSILKGKHSLFLLLLILAGCTEEIGEHRSEGISAEFTQGTQSTVYETQELMLIVDVFNKGSYDAPYGKVVLGGFDSSILPFESRMPGKNIAIKTLPKIQGTNEYNEEGGLSSVQFRVPKNNIILPYEGDYSPELTLKTCYYYETTASPSVCIVPDPSKVKEDICTPETIKPENQNAPVSVTRVEEQVMHDFVNFAVTIKNMGEGEVIAPTQKGYENCPNELSHNDKNIVYVEMKLNDFLEPECANDGQIKLNNGEGTAVCKFQISPESYDVCTYETNSDPYIKQLKINLKYHYLTKNSKKITVKKNVDLISTGDGGQNPNSNDYNDDLENNNQNTGSNDNGEISRETNSPNCDCKAEHGYDEPHKPCICLYYGGREYFCGPKQEPLEVTQENPSFTIYTSDPSVVKRCGISGFNFGNCGEPLKHQLELGDEDVKKIAVVGLDSKEETRASQWCEIKKVKQ